MTPFLKKNRRERKTVAKHMRYRPCSVPWCPFPARPLSKIPECEHHHRLRTPSRQAAMDAMISTLQPVKVPSTWAINHRKSKGKP